MSDLIMVVDDNPYNLQILGQLLQKEGYEITMAMNGIDALRSLKHEIPQLILLDIMMPDMDGYEVCSEVKKDDSLKDIPIIFITAKSEVDDIVKGFDVGGVDYVTKPFRARELVARVKTHIELKKARAEIEALHGILPICANCHKIRDDKGFWERVDVYVSKHSDALFSHAICPDCMEKLYGDYLHD